MRGGGVEISRTQCQSQRPPLSRTKTAKSKG
nr:MAG TPA: hypothetical protein [Caudoviricetes sp.]